MTLQKRKSGNFQTPFTLLDPNVLLSLTFSLEKDRDASVMICLKQSPLSRPDSRVVT
jgi:hypothetical protein